MAGLSAALHLNQRGIKDVVLLEARDKVGGRVRAVETEGAGPPFDLGAQWIQGACPANTVFNLANRFV